jgi:hypothetical protein
MVSLSNHEVVTSTRSTSWFDRLTMRSLKTRVSRSLPIQTQGNRPAPHSSGATFMRYLAMLGILPLLCLSGSPARSQTDMISITPEQIGQVFCIGRLGNDMSPVTGVMTEDLVDIIDDAFTLSNQYALSHPGEMPPMGEGVRWSTLRDYADGCTVGDASVRDLVAYVEINYTFSKNPNANYSDTLMLLPNYPENGPPYIWRIYDIELAAGVTTREFLYAAIEASTE